MNYIYLITLLDGQLPLPRLEECVLLRIRVDLQQVILVVGVRITHVENLRVGNLRQIGVVLPDLGQEQPLHCLGNAIPLLLEKLQILLQLLQQKLGVAQRRLRATLAVVVGGAELPRLTLQVVHLLLDGLNLGLDSLLDRDPNGIRNLQQKVHLAFRYFCLWFFLIRIRELIYELFFQFF